MPFLKLMEASCL